MQRASLLLVLLLGISNVSFAADIGGEIEAFYANPRSIMNRPPLKAYDSSFDQAYSVSQFPSAMTESRDYIAEKIRVERACRRADGHAIYSEFDDRNDPIFFPDNEPPVQTLEQMHALGLTEVHLEQEPWSGHYWPIAKGVLGARMFDQNFLDLTAWKDRLEYVQKNNFFSLYLNGNDKERAALAPSEKYDLVTANFEAGATVAMWLEGKPYFDRDGKVESWMGICHGWASASFMNSKPMRAVQVPAYDGKHKITFYPSEMKGLQSYLWSKAIINMRFLGQRCNAKNPEMDENGRYTDPICQDVNPGAWHIAVVNQLGVAKRSFVMDATVDYEVWNQPVFAYSYSYFNVQNSKVYGNPEAAMIPIREFERDLFKKYRSNKAKYIVGIAMRVGYTLENSAEQTTEPTEDNKKWVQYIYDLELDEAKNIIGGEWYTNFHPDFLWVPEQTTSPRNVFDSGLEPREWDGVSALPVSWQQNAKAAAKYGLLLSTIVEALVAKATGDGNETRAQERERALALGL